MNGSGKKAFKSFAQDIANHEVRPDVWVEVHKMINPASVHRAPNPPKPTYVPSPPAGGYAKEADAPNPTPKEAGDHEKEAKAVPELTEEEMKAKREAGKPKKQDPESEAGDLDPPKHDDEDEDDKKEAFVQYDSENQLWRFVQLQ